MLLHHSNNLGRTADFGRRSQLRPRRPSHCQSGRRPRPRREPHRDGADGAAAAAVCAAHAATACAATARAAAADSAAAARRGFVAAAAAFAAAGRDFAAAYYAGVRDFPSAAAADRLDKCVAAARAAVVNRNNKCAAAASAATDIDRAAKRASQILFVQGNRQFWKGMIMGGVMTLEEVVDDIILYNRHVSVRLNNDWLLPINLSV